MREVNPDYKNPSRALKAILVFIAQFLKRPLKKITEIPDWSWTSLFMIQVCIALISGVLAGLIKFNIYRIAYGLILMPVVSTIAALLLSTFIYYYFQFFENRMEPFKKLFSLVIVASIPFYLFQVISEYLALVSLIGFAITSFLLVVGLNETFRLPRKRCYQLVGVLFLLVTIAWIANQFTMY